MKVSFRIALILMVLSLFACREVASPDGLAEVGLGLPIAFVALDARSRPPERYPACLRFGDPHLDRMRLRPLAALGSLALLMGGLLVGAHAFGLHAGASRERGRLG